MYFTVRLPFRLRLPRVDEAHALARGPRADHHQNNDPNPLMGVFPTARRSPRWSSPPLSPPWLPSTSFCSTNCSLCFFLLLIVLLLLFKSPFTLPFEDLQIAHCEFLAFVGVFHCRCAQLEREKRVPPSLWGSSPLQYLSQARGEWMGGHRAG